MQFGFDYITRMGNGNTISSCLILNCRLSCSLSHHTRRKTEKSTPDPKKLFTAKKSMMITKVLLACLLPVCLQAQGSFTITAGTQLKLTGGALLTLDNCSLENHGSLLLSPGDGTIRFSGNTNATISGSSQPQFDVLELAKTGGATLGLQRNIGIASTINFTSGNLDLNNQNILLQPGALLNSESETSRIVGTGGGFVEITANLNAPSAINPGNLGAMITSTQNLGSTVIRRGHRSQANCFGLGNSVLRYYDISPANNTSLNATLQFQYLDAELNSLGENTLVFWKSDNNSFWQQIGFDTRDMALNYVGKAGVASFSRFTLSSINNPLPAQWGLITTRCSNNGVELKWQTLQEANTRSFTIQTSADGNAWSDLHQIAAAGNSNTPVNYEYLITQATAFIRLVQKDADGRQSLSAVLRNPCTQKDIFQVYPNPFATNLTVSVSTVQQQIVSIQLFDAKGRLVLQKGQSLQRGNNQFVLALPPMTSGIYRLVLNWPNGKQQAVSLLHQ
jgi:hypothetical protein